MTEFHRCDICGRSEEDSAAEANKAPIKYTKDEDGLWLCSECQTNLKTSPTIQADEDDLDERIKGLIGKSAGAICRTADLPFVPPYKTIIEAAEQIAYDEDRYMSAWSFVTQWVDGTTVWQSEDKSAKAIVDTKGNVQIERDW
jgi:hypothetical protein